MEYCPPQFNALVFNISNIKLAYKNSQRLSTIHLLEVLIEAIKELETNGEREQQSLINPLLGAYLFCLKVIGKEYKYFDPKFSKGIFFHSGSTLYTLFLKYLEINLDKLK